MTEENVRRVVHVLYSGLGGHGAVMFGMLDAGFFSRAEHLVLLTGVEPPVKDYVNRLDRDNIVWRYVPKKPGHGYVEFYRHLRHAIFENCPDLVFVHGLATIPSVVWNKSPALVLVRETEPQSTKSIKDWGALAVAHASVDAIVYLTDDAAKVAADHLRVLHRQDKVSIIGNGLDVDFYSPASKDAEKLLARPVVRLGMVARLQPKKDHSTLIDAFDHLCADRPSLDLKLEIAGDGSTRQMLEDDILRRGLQDRVTFHGTLGAEGVRDLLRSLDIYVHATFGETMSNSIMQAMAVGLPVVASAVSGVTNMVTPEVGLLYPSGDSSSLRATLNDLLDNPDEARRLGKAARAHAVRHYDAKLTARAYEELTYKLIRQRDGD
ncbi:glycosyltransferase family 4 protein [uncultured Marivita sp.]|uniref:glycosyltransferase family 4 protein n=1 Tax=uncultured Marivita sp. TaxID=888080 RepID=UPI0026148069|nr:glycosyltransferase family 4 protein [uncultured Marivita sp.]